MRPTSEICLKVVVLALLLVAQAQLASGEIDAIGWDVKQFESPEDEVTYLMDESKRAVMRINDSTSLVLNRKMAADPEVYFPLFYDRIVSSADREEAGIAAGFLVLFKKTHRKTIRSIYMRMIRGEFDEATALPDKGALLGRMVVDFRLIGAVGHPEDAWELLPHIETEYGQSVLRTVAEIGNPEIIPALLEAAEGRFQAGYIEEHIVKPIRKRHAQAEASTQGAAAAPNPEPLAVDKTDIASAPNPTAPPAAVSAEQLDGTPSALWALPVLLGMLAIYITVIRRRKSK